MNDGEVDNYIHYLWTQYQTDDKEVNKGIGKLIEEVREKLLSNREIVMNFNIEEIHDLHMALSECIEFHKIDKEHKKEHGDKCPYCEQYKKLYDRIVENCECVDNPKEKLMVNQGV